LAGQIQNQWREQGMALGFAHLSAAVVFEIDAE
jgi:aryl carrier-like protein